jgi:hypothetical protein
LLPGQFIIQAKDLEKAVSIAKRFPSVKTGEALSHRVIE